MPTISMFLGIIITMNYNDHMPPHFHASYQGHDATFFLNGDLKDGQLPKKQMRYVAAWASLHEDELVADWELARNHVSLYQIDPLR